MRNGSPAIQGSYFFGASTLNQLEHSSAVRVYQGPGQSTDALVILDESVAALDVSIQAQVLNLLADIREETGVSDVLISHDLAVVRQLAEQTIVLRRGQVVERGSTGQVLDDPRHEYTQRLRASVPRPGWKPTRQFFPSGQN